MIKNDKSFSIMCSLLCLMFAAIGGMPAVAAVSTKIVWGVLPLAGFQHYAGKRAWADLKPGDPLALVREADNPYDSNAIRVEWRGEKLGYLPRAGNAELARRMDQGLRVAGRIQHLQAGRSHWQRIMIEVVIETQEPMPQPR